jgi:hypothetical protein
LLWHYWEPAASLSTFVFLWLYQGSGKSIGGEAVIGFVCDSNLTKIRFLSAENKKDRIRVPREQPDCESVVTRYGSVIRPEKTNRNIGRNSIGGRLAELLHHYPYALGPNDDQSQIFLLDLSADLRRLPRRRLPCGSTVALSTQPTCWISTILPMTYFAAAALLTSWINR